MAELTLSVTEAGQLLGVGKASLYRAIREGRMPALRIGQKRSCGFRGGRSSDYWRSRRGFLRRTRRRRARRRSGGQIQQNAQRRWRGNRGRWAGRRIRRKQIPARRVSQGRPTLHRAGRPGKVREMGEQKLSRTTVGTRGVGLWILQRRANLLKEQLG